MGLDINTRVMVVYGKDGSNTAPPHKLFKYLHENRSRYETDSFQFRYATNGKYSYTTVTTTERLWANERLYFPSADMISDEFPVYAVVSTS